MIKIILRGGLGNQMFQYAAGLNLAKKNNTGLVLDTTFLNDRFPRKQFTYRAYDLDAFAFESRFTPLSKISSAIPIPGLWLGLDLAFAHAKKTLSIGRFMKEKSEGVFDPEIFRAGANAVLWGFWQSQNYFVDCGDDVRSAFRFRHPLIGEAKALAEKIESCDSVSLHVRRADYLLPKYAKEYGATDTSYYDRAFARVAERISRPELFVFSDDIAWCRENIKLPCPMTYVDNTSAGPKNAFHLELMSLCRHNIITNSSFSWWGAWLNRNQGKIVIAPKRWFAGREGPDDVVPASWIRM